MRAMRSGFFLLIIDYGHGTKGKDAIEKREGCEKKERERKIKGAQHIHTHTPTVDNEIGLIWADDPEE